MRPLCKVVSASLGTDKGRSIYLNQLFPGSPAKIAAKLADFQNQRTVYK